MAKNYIEISPDDKEVLEILSNLNNEMGNISFNEILDIQKLKKYSEILA
jgi:hypothetical protein